MMVKVNTVGMSDVCGNRARGSPPETICVLRLLPRLRLEGCGCSLQTHSQPGLWEPSIGLAVRATTNN